MGPRQHRILVVEDEAVIAMLPVQTLVALGYPKPARAMSGSEALVRAAEHAPDLELLDVGLGNGIDGVETARRLHELYDLGVVFLSAYSDPETLARLQATKPHGILLKPVSTTDLARALEAAGAQLDAERQLRLR